MIDLALLQLLRFKEDYKRVKGRIPDASLDPQTLALIEDFGKYFYKFPEHEAVDMITFLPMFRAWHPTLSKDQYAAYEVIIKNVQKELPEEARVGILDTLLELRLGTNLASLLARYDSGDLPDINGALHRALDEYKADATGATVDYVEDNISDLLKEEIDNSGLHWRLECLNESMRGLRPGDFGIIAARPDKGKTTFIASEVTYLASQLDSGKCILWLNNEGPGKRILPRLYQAALGATIPELAALDGGGLLGRAYEKAMCGTDRIRVVNIHGRDAFTVEQIIERNNAYVVIYDMIDNIRGFGDQPRTDLKLEEMYKWARTVSVEHDVIGLATSQISNEGDGLLYPTLGMLKDSKTGKQGACDFMLMIGASNDPNLSGVRHLGMPKNKLRRPGGPGDPRATVNYDPQIVRFSDLPILMEAEEQSNEQTQTSPE